MVQKSGTGKLVGGCVAAIVGFFSFITGIICLPMGIIFGIDPYNVNINVNGETLYGEEAAEAALKAASVLKTVGTVAIILGIAAIILAIVLIVGYNKIKKENAMAMQQYGYGMQNQYCGQNQYGGQNPYMHN